MADNSSMEFDHYGNKNLNYSSHFSFLFSTFLDQQLHLLIMPTTLLRSFRSTVAPVDHADQVVAGVFGQPLRRLITPTKLLRSFWLTVPPVDHADQVVAGVFGQSFFDMACWQTVFKMTCAA